MVQTKNLGTLAILGGSSIRKREWPKWPRVTAAIQEELLQVLHSGRWAVSGAYMGKECNERRFSRAYADYMGAKYCIPTTSGTNALLLAFLALGIGPGDEVLVPGLTWVACASVVARLGAVPILVDIDQRTLTMSLESARKAISSRTKAIMLVHLYGSVGNLDGFIDLSQETNIPIIEDCAQAHGTEWKGKKVGTFGKIGCFSMQQSKLLTSGEGGAAITSNEQLASLMEQLRSDGRVFNKNPKIGQLELVEVGEIQGSNMCLSEFQAAVLLGGLKKLEEENKIRADRAELLKSLLKTNGFQSFEFDKGVTFPTYYNFLIKCDLNEFNNSTIDALSRAISEELKANINPIYKPLNKHPLYCPTKQAFVKTEEKKKLLDPSRFSLPNADAARASYLTLHHSLLLDDEEGMQDVVDALNKLRENKEGLLRLAQESSNIAF